MIAVSIGWCLLIEFRAGASWCGTLFDPSGKVAATWTGKGSADDLVETAATFVDVAKSPESAAQMRRHWKAIRRP